MIIPAGKKVKIRRLSYDESEGEYKSSKGPVIDTNIPMVLEEPVTLSLSSEFSPIWGGSDNKWRDVLSGALAGAGFESIGGLVGGKHKVFGMQTWKGTDPLSMGITVSFYADKTNFNPYEQVYRPIMILAQIPLPGELDSGFMTPPGPSVLDVFEKSKNPDLYSLQIGSILYLPRIIIKKAEPTFSTETDTDGYPIWGKVALDVQSLQIATKNLLQNNL